MRKTTNVIAISYITVYMLSLIVWVADITVLHTITFIVLCASIIGTVAYGVIRTIIKLKQ